MPTTAIGAVQAAIFTAISALCGGRVYDDAPDGATFPYITLGEFTENRLDTFGRKGKNITATLHIWSQYHGTKEATDTLALMDAALDQVALTVTGWNLIDISREFAETFKDPDGETRHLVARYRVMVHP